MMEHRHFSRIPAVYEVSICQQGQTVVIAETQNISKFGMFVDTRKLKNEVSRYFKIEVTSKKDRQKKTRVQALVVHRNSDGVGLALDSMFEFWSEVCELNSSAEIKEGS